MITVMRNWCGLAVWSVEEESDLGVRRVWWGQGRR